MSFNVLLQKNMSENNRLDKEIQNLFNFSGTLKNESSIIDPTILIEISADSLKECNYMTISTFGRSYFVTNIKSIRSNLTEITAHCDVISSFKSELKECEGIVLRQEKTFNTYLDDGSFKLYQNPKIVTKNFPNGFNTMQLILTVAG